MGHHIGEIITGLREGMRCTQSQLSKKLCSVTELTRIESNQRVPNQFLLDMLFERLGKATDRLEYILPNVIYQLYELRFRIQREILYRRLEAAEELLEEYEKKKAAYQPLHTQFIEQERAQIAWIRKEDAGGVLEHLQKAIAQTMEEEPALNRETLLSVDEIRLLLFRWEVCLGTEEERSVRELGRILEYMEQRGFETEELVRVYPYAVILYERQGIFAKKEVQEAAEKALELLRDSGQILFLVEILEILIRYSESEQEEKEYREFRRSVVEVQKEYEVHYEEFPLFRCFNRLFELDSDVIRRTRSALHLSQEALCEDICTQETLSRIERGKNAPGNETMQRLMKKMNREWQRVAMDLAIEKYEMMQAERTVAKLESRKEYERCEKEFEKLKDILDMTLLENQQYFALKKLMFMVKKQECSYDEAIAKLYEILKLTLECKFSEIYKYPLTHREVLILNLIAVYHCWKGEVEAGVKVWGDILSNLEGRNVAGAFLSREWELIAGNIARRPAELGDEQRAVEICDEQMKMELEIGKGAHIAYLLEIMTYALDRVGNENYIFYFRNAMQWFKLMKHIRNYLFMKKYSEENKLNLER